MNLVTNLTSYKKDGIYNRGRQSPGEKINSQIRGII